jgi:hypothetical protein
MSARASNSRSLKKAPSSRSLPKMNRIEASIRQSIRNYHRNLNGNDYDRKMSDTDYPVSSSDDLYPTEDDGEWTVVAYSKSSRKQPMVRAEEKRNWPLKSILAKNLRKEIRHRTTLRRRESKQTIMNRIKEYAAYWRNKKPDVLSDENDSYLTQFEESLVRFFRSGYERYWNNGEPAEDDAILQTIRDLIKRYKLKISGGYVLKNTGLSGEERSKPSVDIDIYVPYDTPIHYPEFYDTMAKLFNCGKTPEGKYTVNRFFAGPESSSGKQSFFRKNKIYSVFKHERTVNGLYAEMDLVRSMKGTSPLTIIKNFDLTVCMNWYDGNQLYAMDIEAILPPMGNEPRPPGHLSVHYTHLLMGGRNLHGTIHEPHPVTRDRILKYILRGYNFVYMDLSDGEEKEILPSELSNAVQRLPQNKRNLYYKAHPNERPANLNHGIANSNASKNGLLTNLTNIVLNEEPNTSSSNQ